MISFGVVTPSLNQRQFLPQALASVLAQTGPFSVDYCVMDGGSTDGTVAYLEQVAAASAKKENLQFRWVSQPDHGQYAAIQQGFDNVRGDILCWLNSDDIYTPWAFSVVAAIFAANPAVQWLTSVYPMTIDETGASVGVDVRWGYSAKSFRRWVNLAFGKHYSRYYIQQDCTFWRRSLWEKAGSCFDASLDLAADYELWFRFFEHAELYTVASPLAGYRVHAKQKTARAGAYEAEAATVMRARGCAPYGPAVSALRRHVVPAMAAMGLTAVLPPLGLAERVQTFKHGGRGHGWNKTNRYIY